MSFLQQHQLTRINNIIDNLNIKHGLSFPENSILDVAEKLGVSVKTATFKEEDIAGLLDYGTENKRAQIFISETDNEKKRNFTIAHEIGHLLLHKINAGRLKIDRHGIQAFTQKKDEEEANYFAAELLVPQQKLKEIVFKARMHEWDLINYCSEYFNVSKSVIDNRLKWLKF